jgi:hypothetical protein
MTDWQIHGNKQDILICNKIKKKYQTITSQQTQTYWTWIIFTSYDTNNIIHLFHQTFLCRLSSAWLLRSLRRQKLEASRRHCVCSTALILPGRFISIFSSLWFLLALWIPHFSLPFCILSSDIGKRLLTVLFLPRHPTPFVLRTAFFWVIMHRLVAISYRRFGTTHLPDPQGSKILLFSVFSSTGWSRSLCAPDDYNTESYK